MGGLSPIHWLIILLLVLVVFGGKAGSNKISNMMADAGLGLRKFKEGLSGGDEAAKDAAMTPPGSLNAPLPEQQVKSPVNQG
jgi:sec-independent protein translocase protein TatA